MAEFTKGEWLSSAKESSTDDAVITTTVDNQTLTIAKIYGHDNVCADAALIAAAPDLYEALYSLAKEMDSDGLNAGTTYGPMIYKAMQALAKARGEK